MDEQNAKPYERARKGLETEKNGRLPEFSSRVNQDLKRLPIAFTFITKFQPFMLPGLGMPGSFQTLEELRGFIGREQSSRVKFATKLFHVLSFSRSHPGSLMLLGASWCRDGAQFICHSGIMSAFLGLKANSINTNFRDHGFEIVRSSLGELTREFPCLPANNNWKKRANHRYPFTAMSSIEEVERIPCGGTVVVNPKGDPLIHPLPIQIPGDVVDLVKQNSDVARKTFALWETLCEPSSAAFPI